MDSASFTFFGEVDRHPYTKVVTSEFPAWYFTTHMEELQEAVNRKRAALKAGMVDRADVVRVERELAADEHKMEQIALSVPKVSDTRKSDLGTEYKRLSKVISEALPSCEAAKRGLVDAHEEARRMLGACIKMDPALAEACNVKAASGAVSRDGAVKVWKILGKFLGEATNVESLRRIK